MMDFLAFILMILAIGSIYYYFNKKLSYFKDRGVPYEPGLPIFGNMASIIFQVRNFSQMIGDIYKANPDAKYVGAFDFGKPVIILRDPGLIKTVIIKNFDNFQNHLYSVDKRLDPFISPSLFLLKGKRWRYLRNLLSPAFTPNKLKTTIKSMVECGENFNNYVSRLTDEQRLEVATKDLFTKYTSDVIATCAFGITINSLENPRNELYVLAMKNAIFEGLFLFKFYMSNIFPRFMKLFNLKVVNENTANFFKKTVKNVIETRDREGISRPDMIQLMMDAREMENKHHKLTVDEMAAQAFIFFVGGFDTTSSQMCFIAHELAMNPDIQRKLQREIDNIIRETDGQLSYEAIQNMPYFDAVFSESLRRHTEVLILDRACEKPFELPPASSTSKPFVIPPGMGVWISGRSIHMDAKYYPNPEKFDPERYYQKKKIVTNDELNLGFGIGPRSCIGYRFAILTTKVLFIHLLSKFSLVANEKINLPLKHSQNSFAMKPTGGFSVSIKQRDKSTLDPNVISS